MGKLKKDSLLKIKLFFCLIILKCGGSFERDLFKSISNLHWHPFCDFLWQAWEGNNKLLNQITGVLNQFDSRR